MDCTMVAAAPVLPVGYVVSASRIADRRIILAGYRLADLLTRVAGIKGEVSVWLLSEKLLWYVASILCEPLKDSLMQPHIHLGRIAHLVLGAVEFGTKPSMRGNHRTESSDITL